MATDAEIPSNIANGLLSAKKYGLKRVDHYMKRRLLSREASFYDPKQRSTIITSLKKRNRGNIRPWRKPPGSWIICRKIIIC